METMNTEETTETVTENQEEVSENKETLTDTNTESTESKETPVEGEEKETKEKTETTGNRGPRESSRPQRQGYQRNPRFKRKVCKFCFDKNLKIDYKNASLLEQFITDRGKILPRRVTGTCSKHQRGVAMAIKRARVIALLPFIEK